VGLLKKPGDYVVAGAVLVLLLVRPARQILFVRRHALSFPKKSIIADFRSPKND
jgi:hypothetical protein